VAVELEQLTAPSGVVFPDTMVGGFLLCYFYLKKNKTQFLPKKINITPLPIKMAVAIPAYIQIA